MSNHLQKNTQYEPSWAVLTRAPSNFLKRKIRESCFIKQLNPFLNNKLNKNILMFFSYGIV